MRLFTMFAAIIVATACCQESMGQNLLFRTFFGPTTAAPTVEVQPELSASPTSSAAPLVKDSVKKVASPAIVLPDYADTLQFVGYDNCGRMIYRRVNTAAQPVTAARNVNLRTPATTVRPAPQNRSRVSAARKSSSEIDTSFWDDLLSDVEDPLDSD